MEIVRSASQGIPAGSTWTICEGKDCPRLRWEKVVCDQP